MLISLFFVNIFHVEKMKLIFVKQLNDLKDHMS